MLSGTRRLISKQKWMNEIAINTIKPIIEKIIIFDFIKLSLFNRS